MRSATAVAIAGTAIVKVKVNGWRMMPTLSASMLCSTVCGTLKVGVKLEIGVIVVSPSLTSSRRVPVGHGWVSYSNFRVMGEAVDRAGVVDGDEHLDDPLGLGVVDLLVLGGASVRTGLSSSVSIGMTIS